MLREFFRLNKRCFVASMDFVFIAGKGSRFLEYEDVEKELKDSFKKNKLLRVNDEKISI